MQCREAQLILSAMADHEPVSADELAEVREHCRRCPECASFAKSVATLRKAKPQRVPRGLAARITAAVAEEMAADRTEREEAVRAEAAGVEEAAEPGEGAEVVPLPVVPASTAPPAPSPSKGEVPLAWLSRERLWTIIAAVGTSAAVVLLGLMVSGQLTGRASIEQEAKEAVSRSLATQGDTGQSAAQAPTAGSGSAPVSTPASKAPPFVAFNGRVYAPSPSAEEVNASHLTTVGTVYTAMSSGGAPESLNAYSRPSDTSLVIRRTDGTFQVCVPVVRTFGEGVYQLTTGVEIQRYGVWPRLPSDIPEPTAVSGSPVFIGAGSDSLGVRVYARIGFDTSSGIAVAPGTSGSDPSGGNPFWTWWVRVP